MNHPQGHASHWLIQNSCSQDEARVVQVAGGFQPALGTSELSFCPQGLYLALAVQLDGSNQCSPADAESLSMVGNGAAGCAGQQATLCHSLQPPVAPSWKEVLSCLQATQASRPGPNAWHTTSLGLAACRGVFGMTQVLKIFYYTESSVRCSRVESTYDRVFLPFDGGWKGHLGLGEFLLYDL